MFDLLNSPIHANLLSYIRKKFYSFLLMEFNPVGYQAFLKVFQIAFLKINQKLKKESKGENVTV